MKKLLFIMVLSTTVWAVDTELQSLAELTAIAGSDVLYIVDDPGGTPASRKITATNLFDIIDTFSKLNTIIGAGKTLVNEEDAPTLDALWTFALGLTITTGDPFTLGVVRWDDGSDKIDGEQIADDTIDDDSIDFGDVTGADLTLTDCGAITSTGTITAAVGFDITGAADMDYGSADVTDHTFLSDGTGTGEFVLKAGAIDGTEILDDTIKEVDLNATNTPGAGEDNYVLTYNDAGGNFTWAADATGTTKWNEIGDADATGTVDFVTYAQVIDIGITDTGGPKVGLELTATGLGVGTTDVVVLEIGTTANGDADFIPFEIRDDTGAGNVLRFQIDNTGAIATGTIPAGSISGTDAGTDLTVDLEEEVTEGSLANDTIVTANIKDGEIVALDLNTDVTATDEDFLQYDSTGGNFTWRNASETLGDIGAEPALTNKASLESTISDVADFAEADGDVYTGVHDFGGATSVEIPNATDPDVDVAGEISNDTDGANEAPGGNTDAIIRAFDGTNQWPVGQKLKTLTFTLLSPAQITAADLIPIWHNTTGMTFTIVEWKAWSDTDNVSLEIEELTDQTNYTLITTVDAVEIATDGTGVFYASDTTITHAAIEHDHSIAIDFDTADTPGYVQMAITGWFNADVD